MYTTYTYKNKYCFWKKKFNKEKINISPYHAAVWYLPNLSLLPNWDCQNVTATIWSIAIIIENKNIIGCVRIWLPHGIFEQKNYETVEGKMTPDKQEVNTKYSHNFLTHKHDPKVRENSRYFTWQLTQEYFRQIMFWLLLFNQTALKKINHLQFKTSP